MFQIIKIKLMTVLLTITTTLLTNFSETGIKNLLRKISHSFKARPKKNATEYEQYLVQTSASLRQVKTLLNPYSPVDLYSFYVPMDLLAINNNLISPENINNLLAVGDKIIISGECGIGKSTLLKHLFINTIKNTNYIPILLEPSVFNNNVAGNIDLYQIINENFTGLNINMNKDIFTSHLRSGDYLILLDAYDQLDNNMRTKIFHDITCLIRKYPKNKVIISSRPSECFIGWHNFIELKATPFTKQNILDIVQKKKLEYDIKELFIEELFDHNYYLVRTPLLLEMILLVFKKQKKFPNNLAALYEQAFSTLYFYQDNHKNGFKRPWASGLNSNNIKIILSYFAFHSYFDSLHIYHIYENIDTTHILIKALKKFEYINCDVFDLIQDLTHTIPFLEKRGDGYFFIHRSFQEYFAAYYSHAFLPECQQRFFFLKELEHIGCYSNSVYLKTLYSMEKNVFFKTNILPEILALKSEFQKYGLCKKFLLNFCYKISITTIDNKNNSQLEFRADSYTHLKCFCLQFTLHHFNLYPEMYSRRYNLSLYSFPLFIDSQKYSSKRIYNNFFKTKNEKKDLKKILEELTIFQHILSNIFRLSDSLSLTDTILLPTK